MLLPGGRSGLVRLSDSLKIALDLCERSSRVLLTLVDPYLPTYRESQWLTRAQVEGRLDPEEGSQRIREVLSTIPDDVATKVAYLHGHEVHSLSLSAILLSCFCLESYINTLAYFLFRDADLLGLIREGHENSAEVIINAIARMTIREKWRTVGRLNNDRGFDASRPPFQDFQILFRFRDDQVHDKIVEWGSAESSKRYNGKFPEDRLGPLDLGHALYAAEAYWGMVQEVHRLTEVPQADFHRHYNVKPWLDDKHRQALIDTAKNYRRGSGTAMIQVADLTRRSSRPLGFLAAAERPSR